MSSSTPSTSGASPSPHVDPAVVRLAATIQHAKNSGTPPEVLQSLQEVQNLLKRREDFVEKMTSPESDACKTIADTTEVEDWNKLFNSQATKACLQPSMLVGHVAGQFLKSLISIQSAERVLELGTFTGYSALCMAEALPADGELVSVEIDPFVEKYAEGLLKTCPHGKKIKIVLGDGKRALLDMVEFGDRYDLIFLDANKEDYKDYVDIILRHGMLAPRGTLVVDNVFWWGSSYGERCCNDMKKFQDYIKRRKDVHRCLVPIGDGMLLLRMKSDVEGDL